MYVLPQEIESKYIIPAIRRDLSIRLMKEYHLPYSKIGKLLGITKAAISQYICNKRASKIKLHPDIKVEINKSSEKIIRGKSDVVVEITRILKIIRKKKLHCEICGKIINGKLHDCKQIIARYKED